jgi:FixJ family two-component response regulator
MNNHRVIIVDDDADIRDGLQAWLSQDYLVEAFDSADSFLAAINNFDFEDHIPSCILLDFQMPNMNGVELQKTLKQIHCEFPIIFMSGNAHQSDVIDAWHEGAVDFILKPFEPRKMSAALEKLFASAKQLQDSLKSESNSFTPIDPPITQREAQVLLLLGKGHEQQEVAEILGLSLRTVKMYRTFLKNKLNLHTLMQLGRYYDKHQLSIEKIAAFK